MDDPYIERKSRLCQVIRKKINMVQESASNGVCVVGIYGMGGSGKTTLCKALCNEYNTQFHGRVCPAELGKDNEVALIQGMLERLTDTKHDLVTDSNIDECRELLKRNIHKRRAFLALDINVFDSPRITNQAMSYLRVGYRQGSIIIVRAWMLVMLQALKISESDFLEMPELKEAEAKSLFMHHANLPTHEANKEIIIQHVEQCRFNP